MGCDMYLHGEKKLFPLTDAKEDGFRVSSIIIDFGDWKNNYELHDYIISNFAEIGDPRIWLEAKALEKIITQVKKGFNKPVPRKKMPRTENNVLSEDQKYLATEHLLNNLTSDLVGLENSDLKSIQAKYFQLLGEDVPVISDSYEEEEQEETIRNFENALQWLLASNSDDDSDEISRRVFYKAE